MAKKDNQKIALIEVELVSLKDGFPLPLQLPLLPSTASRESTGYEEYILKTSPESQMISNRFYTKEDWKIGSVLGRQCRLQKQLGNKNVASDEAEGKDLREI